MPAFPAAADDAPSRHNSCSSAFFSEAKYTPSRVCR
jgi:hypothetical protein